MNKRPHPALRATFSRKREKGVEWTLVVPFPRQGGGRCRRRMGVCAEGAQARPHPALRATFSRKRETGVE